MNDDAQVPPSPCPFCSHVMDMASPADGETVAPTPGDVSICIRCGGLLEFDGQLHLISLSDVKREGLDEKTREWLRRAQEAVLKLKARRRDA